MPVPSPGTVWAAGDRQAARVVDVAGLPVTVNGRGEASAAPARLEARGWSRSYRVEAWAGPWPVEERWWDPAQQRRAARLQVVLDDDSAWLVVLEGGCWWLAARYD